MYNCVTIPEQEGEAVGFPSQELPGAAAVHPCYDVRSEDALYS